MTAPSRRTATAPSVLLSVKRNKRHGTDSLVLANGKDGGSLESPSLVCGDRLTNVLVSGTMGMRNGGIAVVPYLCRYYYPLLSLYTAIYNFRCTLPKSRYYYFFILASYKHANWKLYRSATPYLPRYHPNKKRNSTRVSLFAFYASVTRTFSSYTATSSG